ncbi:MAG: MGMT family protein, partial [Anaerolineae bacterium]
MGDFFSRVYRLVSMIPRGKVASYGQIARMLGSPRGARTVGWALHGLPEGTDVPWHRVIN